MAAKTSKNNNRSASVLFRFSSLMMASLFAVSASFQLNDPDWFFWFPLYTCGCITNLVNGLSEYWPQMRLRVVAKFSLWLGILLFIKLAIEDHRRLSPALLLWSLDMRERFVREKIGSCLVSASMFLHLRRPPPPPPTSGHHHHHHHQHPQKAQESKVPKLTHYGMVILVIISYGLSLLFHLRQYKDMKFS